MVKFLFCVLLLGTQFATAAFAVQSKAAISDSDINTVIRQMRQQDKNAAKDGDIELNYQNKANATNFNQSNSPKPLFTRVNENLFNGATYKAYLSLVALFVSPDVCVSEQNTATQNAPSYDFIDVVSNTTLFDTMWKYLSSNGLASSNYSVFREDLHTLWFGQYPRCDKGNFSSGFEHVFVGEYNKDKTVLGQHYWVQFYQLEKAGQVDYHGWFEPKMDVLITLQYAWDTMYEKPTGSFLIGTSPEFDFSLFTLCVLSKPGTKACKFALDSYSLDVSYNLGVTALLQNNTTGDFKIKTSYPSVISISSGGGAQETSGSNWWIWIIVLIAGLIAVGIIVAIISRYFRIRKLAGSDLSVHMHRIPDGPVVRFGSDGHHDQD